METEYIKYIEELKAELNDGTSNVNKDFWKIGLKLAEVKRQMQRNKAQFCLTESGNNSSNFSKFIYEQLEKKICRRFVYHLMAAGEIMSNLDNHKEKMGWRLLPSNERQCREMKSLTAEQQVVAWDAVLKSKSKITNTLIRHTIKTLYPKKNDENNDENVSNSSGSHMSMQKRLIAGLEDEGHSRGERLSRKVSRTESMMSVSSVGSCGSDMHMPSSPELRKSPVLYGERRAFAPVNRKASRHHSMIDVPLRTSTPPRKCGSYDFSIEALTSSKAPSSNLSRSSSYSSSETVSNTITYYKNEQPHAPREVEYDQKPFARPLPSRANISTKNDEYMQAPMQNYRPRYASVDMQQYERASAQEMDPKPSYAYNAPRYIASGYPAPYNNTFTPSFPAQPNTSSGYGPSEAKPEVRYDSPYARGERMHHEMPRRFVVSDYGNGRMQYHSAQRAPTNTENNAPCGLGMLACAADRA
eukprot:Nk52_evm12s292 gene=Nk52_evmTU12s292